MRWWCRPCDHKWEYVPPRYAGLRVPSCCPRCGSPNILPEPILQPSRQKLLAARVAVDELAEVFAEAVTKATNIGDRARMRRALKAIELARDNVGSVGLVFDEALKINKGEISNASD